jgi:hypothetical protein
MQVQEEMQGWQVQNALLISQLGGNWVQQGPGISALITNPLAWADMPAAKQQDEAALATVGVLDGR